jgi:hypothetical protein
MTKIASNKSECLLFLSLSINGILRNSFAVEQQGDLRAIKLGLIKKLLKIKQNENGSICCEYTVEDLKTVIFDKPERELSSCNALAVELGLDEIAKLFRSLCQGEADCQATADKALYAAPVLKPMFSKHLAAGLGVPIKILGCNSQASSSMPELMLSSPGGSATTTPSTSPQSRTERPFKLDDEARKQVTKLLKLD